MENKPLIERLNWPAVVVFAITVFAMVGTMFGFAIAVPSRLQDKIFDLPWGSIWPVLAPMLLAGITTVWQAFVGPLVHPKTDAPVASSSSASPTTTVVRRRDPSTYRGDRTSSGDGFFRIEVGLLIIAAGFILMACGVLPGCGSAIHGHAIAAHAAHEAVDTAGGVIVEAERAALAACPHDDGADRVACLEHAEHTFTLAAASRDLLIPIVDSYRALTFEACGIDPSSDPIVVPDECTEPEPAIMSRIETMAVTVIADQAILASSIAALQVQSGGGR